jgi:hypothetical protein
MQYRTAKTFKERHLFKNRGWLQGVIFREGLGNTWAGEVKWTSLVQKSV